MRPTILRLTSEMPTESSLLTEARELGATVAAVRFQVGDLQAEAGEQLRARADAPELEARGYLVTDAHFERLRILASMLAPMGSRRSQLEVDRDLAHQQLERARLRLLAIRERFSRIGVAVGHPASLFSFSTRATLRVNVVTLGMEEVIQNIEQLGSEMPDHATVDALLAEARALVASTPPVRRHANALRLELAVQIKLTAQVSRLLYETLMHLSSQGLAAFDDDLKRRAPYSLTSLQAAKTRRQQSLPPTA